MIRFIIDNKCRKMDGNGNRYWFAVVTSTRTGKSVRIGHAAPCNIAFHLRAIMGDGDLFHETEETIPAREFDRMNKFVALNVDASDAMRADAMRAVAMLEVD